MNVVSILNHKGGVGKTTVAGCTAQALALAGFRVLAVDNDSQHNLSTMLGTGVYTPGIRDVYRAEERDAPALLLKSVVRTDIADLHAVTSHRSLSESDISDPRVLERTIQACKLDRFYDYVIVDNAPGLGRLQDVSIRASNQIFVPTELRQFAVDGIAEMEVILRERYGGTVHITRVIPNFYKDTKRQNAFLGALARMFPGRVTSTPVPMDNVFDELVTEGKVLLLHRLYSRGAAYFLKLIHELFDLDEDEVWEHMLERRKARLSDEARERFYRQRGLEES